VVEVSHLSHVTILWITLGYNFHNAMDHGCIRFMMSYNAMDHNSIRFIMGHNAMNHGCIRFMMSSNAMDHNILYSSWVTTLWIMVVLDS
jgi:hypothetical protein